VRLNRLTIRGVVRCCSSSRRSGAGMRKPCGNRGQPSTAMKGRPAKRVRDRDDRYRGMTVEAPVPVCQLLAYVVRRFPELTPVLCAGRGRVSNADGGLAFHGTSPPANPAGQTRGSAGRPTRQGVMKGSNISGQERILRVCVGPGPDRSTYAPTRQGQHDRPRWALSPERGLIFLMGRL
jgi:hypothetical protein